MAPVSANTKPCWTVSMSFSTVRYQRRLTQRILGEFLSSKGYLQVNHIMMLEEFLANTETQGFLRGNEDCFVTIFGEPSRDASWSIRFEGHHVSLNVTVGPDAIDVTPSFLGASPAHIPAGALAGFNPLRYEPRYAKDLLDFLDNTQRAAAVLSDVPPRGDPYDAIPGGFDSLGRLANRSTT